MQTKLSVWWTLAIVIIVGGVLLFGKEPLERAWKNFGSNSNDATAKQLAVIQQQLSALQVAGQQPAPQAKAVEANAYAQGYTAAALATQRAIDDANQRAATKPPVETVFAAPPITQQYDDHDAPPPFPEERASAGYQDQNGNQNWKQNAEFTGTVQVGGTRRPPCIGCGIGKVVGVALEVPKLAVGVAFGIVNGILGCSSCSDSADVNINVADRGVDVYIANDGYSHDWYQANGFVFTWVEYVDGGGYHHRERRWCKPFEGGHRWHDNRFGAEWRDDHIGGARGNRPDGNHNLGEQPRNRGPWSSNAQAFQNGDCGPYHYPQNTALPPDNRRDPRRVAH